MDAPTEAAMSRAARLHRAVAAAAIPERDAVDEQTLHDHHWSVLQPLVLRGGASGWEAARWTFPDLRRRFAWAPMDVSVRGEGWWLAPRQTRRMAFGDFVDAALGPPSDALYADGRSDVLAQAGLAPLRAELGTLPGLVDGGAPIAWVGPAGTVTPTHHDLSMAWQVVLVGRKRLHLASPLEGALAATTVGLFNTADPRQPQADVRWYEVELGPGDAIFVPVGWWHRVEALEPSFTVSMSRFRWPNAFPWYVPGGE
jgi:Cupin-like domain